MSAAATGSTALRVLTQLRRDPRTVVLLLIVPALLVALLRFVFDGNEATFDRLGAPLIGLFPFILMFLVTSITMLRERTTGTLERLMTLPLAKLDLLAGYALAFALFAAMQALVVSAVAFGLLDLSVDGSGAAVVALAVGNALLGMSLGTALLGQPDVLVLDEPTVGLDPMLREDLWASFRELADRGTTIFVSSHVMDEAGRCDHLLLMREGSLLASLTPEDLSRRTGETDMERAFVRLIDHEEVAV